MLRRACRAAAAELEQINSAKLRAIGCDKAALLGMIKAIECGAREDEAK
jgi:hypothetical protein